MDGLLEEERSRTLLEARLRDDKDENLSQTSSYERGLSREERDTSLVNETELTFSDILGYNPDKAAYNTKGKIEMQEDSGIVHISYVLEDNPGLQGDGLTMPLVMRADEETIETALSSDLEYASLEVLNNRNGVGLGFSYNAQEWVSGSKETAETIKEFERDLGLYKE